MDLALFDLDGTLLPGDSDHAFGRFLADSGWVDRDEHARRNEGFYADYLAGALDLDAYVDFATAGWRARPEADALALRARFMREAIAPLLRPEARALVDAHRRAGDLVAIVTATNEFVTRPIADAFGVDALISVELARDADGRATGRIAGTPSFREGKIARVEAWLAGLGLPRGLAGFARSTFYSDSTNDLALLERVTDPVATNPAPALEAVARERGWRILRLFDRP